jgi:hypothetical protein
MKTNKLALLFIAAVTMFTACQNDDPSLDEVINNNNSTTTTNDTVWVAFTDGGATITNGATDVVTAKQAGGHVALISSAAKEINVIVSGTGTNNSLYVEGSYKMTLTLNGVNITNPDSAAIRIKNGKRINVVVNGTNTLADAATGTDHKATFWIKGHAEFSGAGSLTVSGNYKHAIKTGEYCTLTSDFTGTISVDTAQGDALRCAEYFDIENGNVNIAGAIGDGIQVDSAEVDDVPTTPGYILVNGGNINVTNTTSDTKCIRCDGAYTQTAGTVTVNLPSGKLSSKGIKIGGNGTLSGGTINAICAGNGSKGISGDANFTMTGGTISMRLTGGKDKVTDPTDPSNCFGIKLDGTWSKTGGTGNIYVGINAKAAIKDASTTYGASDDDPYTYTF